MQLNGEVGVLGEVCTRWLTDCASEVKEETRLVDPGHVLPVRCVVAGSGAGRLAGSKGQLECYNAPAVAWGGPSRDLAGDVLRVTWLTRLFT